ncbi:MAG: hypothetical protein R3Y43_01530 [Alphaproteobacteria bacterium]
MENIHFFFEVINILIYALAFILWHKLKAIEDRHDKTKNDLSLFKTHVAERYSPKKDIEEMERRINEQLITLSKRMEQGFQMIYQQLLNRKDK